MKLTSHTVVQFTAAVALMAPSLAVMGARFISPGGGVRTAAAAVVHTEPLPPLEMPRVEITERQRAAIRRTLALEAVGPLESPFLHPKEMVEILPPEPVVRSVQPVVAQPEPEPEPVEPPRVRLRSIFRHGGVFVAVLNGRLYHVGDRLVEDRSWLISRISAGEAEVELRHDSGHAEVIRLRREPAWESNR